MPDLSFQETVSHSREQMFELVADIESYPLFMPHCEFTRILSAGEDGLCALVDAEMGVQFGLIRQAYISHVRLDASAMTIHAESDDGPFKRLDSLWTFETGSGGTAVKMTLSYEFRNAMLGAMANQAFVLAQNQIVEAFFVRADALYNS